MTKHGIWTIDGTEVTASSLHEAARKYLAIARPPRTGRARLENGQHGPRYEGTTTAADPDGELHTIDLNDCAGPEFVSESTLDDTPLIYSQP